MTRTPKNARPISVGIRTHSAHGRDEGGWATYVVLSGSKAEPHILARGRMRLCDPKIEGSDQPFHRAGTIFPFHRAQPMDAKAREAFIKRCKASSQSLAARALQEIVSTHGALNACCVLTGPERPMPPLSGILASHALTHAAERAFYREAVRNAAEAKGIVTEMVIERDLPALTRRLPGTEADRRGVLTSFGKQVGRPWVQEEKLSATAAWLGLAM